MNLKELKQKILKGDFSGIINNGNVKMHPAEMANVFNSLPEENAFYAFQSFPVKRQIVLYPYLDVSLQKSILRSMPKEKAAHILDTISSDDRVQFFSSLKGLELSFFLDYLNDKNKQEIHHILGYPPDSVARMLNTGFATIHQELTVGAAAAHLRQAHLDNESVTVIYVVDKEGKLIDDIPVMRLLLNEPEKPIADILDGYAAKLDINDTKEEAIAKFKKYDREALPVTNEENVLLGVVTADDVLDVAEQKDTAAIQKFGGLEELDYPYVRTPFLSLLKKRAGWLIILFLGEMLTATAMGHFEAEISKAVVLALFVPLIISSGGNSGSQAATLIIRAMALKELSARDWWYVVRRELLSGLSLGIVLGAIGFIRITLWQNLHWYDYGEHWLLVAITIFFSLIGIVMWGTLSGSMIPILLKRMKVDPATSSAPFVATLVDVTGLIIYFTIAAIILKGTLL